ncbi:MAG: sensor histidine kinase [Acidimicrobiales bacterium]
MNSDARRQRLLFSVGAGLLALVFLAPLAYLAYGRAADQAKRETADWATANLADVLLGSRTDQIEPPGNTWEVNVDDGWASPVGEVWTEPPLQGLAADVREGAQFREYDFDGRWLAAGYWAGGSNVLLTVVERETQENAITGARLRWVAITVAMAALAGAITWLVTGRAQAPIERAHDVNRDFIADAAHELRTPLSIIQASAGHALARERPAEDYRQSLTEILDATERAGSGVGELLEFARLEAGQASPRLAALRLDLLMEEVAASVRVEGVVIEAVPTNAVVVAADYNLVRQLFVNLTRNAAARADKVTLTTHLEAKQARVEIADDGPGFDPGIIDHVFERFRRGDRSGSAGLGMAISKTIAELHGGRCEARNSEDGGAIVSVWLPYGPRA